MSNVARIHLGSGSIGGGVYKSISVTSSVFSIDPLPQSAFSGLQVDSLIFEGNTFPSGMSSGAIDNSRTKLLRISGNSFAGTVEREAVKISVSDGGATISHNSFGYVRTGAFEDIKMTKEGDVSFSDNDLSDAAYASLRFDKGRVSFSGSLFTGKNCSCFADPVDEQVSQLLGGPEEYDESTYARISSSLANILECRHTATSLTRRPRFTVISHICAVWR